MAITSAFQADDAGSIPAARSSIYLHIPFESRFVRGIGLLAGLISTLHLSERLDLRSQPVRVCFVPNQLVMLFEVVGFYSPSIYHKLVWRRLPEWQ